MKETLRSQFNLIIAKYERLGLSTPGLDDLRRLVVDEDRLDQMADIMSRTANSEKIFNISKEISVQKNDQRLDEASAEYDTIRNLVTTQFYGSFDTVTYQPRRRDRRWPDIIAENANGKTPVEVKLLTPQDLSPTKFFQKLTDKVRDQAVAQLQSCYLQAPFDKGYIFVWSYQPVQLQSLEYDRLNRWLQARVPHQTFDLTVLCNLYGIGMWDFYL